MSISLFTALDSVLEAIVFVTAVCALLRRTRPRSAYAPSQRAMMLR
jgi:hypothetical protein